MLRPAIRVRKSPGNVPGASPTHWRHAYDIVLVERLLKPTRNFVPRSSDACFTCIEEQVRDIERIDRDGLIETAVVVVQRPMRLLKKPISQLLCK